MNRLFARRFARMALNAASHNSAGIKTGPVAGQPPAPSSDATAAILGASKTDPLGHHEAGKDNGDKEAGAKIKSEKELEKERKKAEKQKKFDEKKAKVAATAGAATSSKSKDKKAKQESGKEEAVLPEYKEKTPLGHKKVLQPLDDPYHKAYIPQVVESAWYAWWEKENFFEPELQADGKVKEEGVFVIPEPPPNVTGALHMGHALPNALQDTLIRWNRMKGLSTLWLPGCDHASISTQSVVEKMLKNRYNKTRHDLGREKFNQTVMEWKEEYHSKINGVLKRMGASLDWSREAFTMDEAHATATREHFVRLLEDGTIYRDNRLVNWCTELKTGVSNLEVDNKDLEGRTLLDVPGYGKKIAFGVLTTFEYELEGGGKIAVATTRPETMLGDTGIAVNPKDSRFTHLIGRYAKHPFVDRRLPIFADEYVDAEFGTGAVKMTPAHDPNDFKLGQKHKLEFINILNDDGTLNENTGDFVGIKRFDARYQVVQALKEKGLYVDEKDNPMKVPMCQKSKDIIEPLLKPQWWMRMRPLAEAAIKAVKDGEITIRPESAERDYYRWLENIQDWCISRQLWWGHRVPAYYVAFEGRARDESDPANWVTGHTEEEAQKKADTRFPGQSFTLQQDPDVFDTWFTSGMWPFSTLGWPRETQDMQNFYPTSLLETGWDILFFWVARMIMLGLKLTGQVPFREVYCHSLVRDSEGRKMSKSLGNVLDPLDVMQGTSLQALHDKLLVGNLDPKELATATKFQKASFPDGIPECGADALRFSLINYTTGGGDINFDVKVMHGYRKFCNKIYQATKYVLGKLPADFKPLPAGETRTGRESLAELWILHKFTTTVDDVNKALAAREFSNATQASYQYWYTNLCDVYIENSKSIIQDGSPEEQHSAQQTLYTALEGGLTLIHPFMPFLTEELWQRLPRRPNDTTPSIVKAKYPIYRKEDDDPQNEEAYELLLAVSKAIRSLAAQYDIKDNANAYVSISDDKSFATCKAQLAAIKTLGGKAATGELARIDILNAGKDAEPTGCVVAPVNANVAVYLLIKGRVDIDGEIAKTKSRLEKASEIVRKQRKMMSGDGWSKMKAEAQATEKRKTEEAEKEVEVLGGSVAQFERLKLQ